MNSAGLKSRSSSLKRVVILDGGTGTSLAKLGHAIDDQTWCSELIKTHPDHVKKVHKDFFLAGADVVVSATYQAFVDGFVKQFSISEEEAYALMRKGVELAREARDEAELETGRHGFVAASVGAYGASLCDRSEYHGRYVENMTREELSAWHLSRIKALADAGPDIVAIETIPALDEALALLQCLEQLQVKAWLTFQLKDEKTTGHGEDIRLALKAVAASPYIVAVGANCFNMAHVDSFLRYVKDLPLLDKPLIVKPNGIKHEDNGRSPENFDIHEPAVEWVDGGQVIGWVDGGASWVGGCCMVDSTNIAHMREALENAPNICFLKKGEDLF
ncbi:homocysteine s-methyltransferase-like protein [Plakobranchus ocellatus]|uniref:Homocysteine s-methyltransferase-like protein n=1 Tax=Plakobranchus ocellatus TaxID=259542 RepID=A0AAV4DXD6_9GAST|nr:homocysteine s-methyltransferase-like protein [Plakobranchus ocellatus]